MDRPFTPCLIHVYSTFGLNGGGLVPFIFYMNYILLYFWVNELCRLNYVSSRGLIGETGVGMFKIMQYLEEN